MPRIGSRKLYELVKKQIGEVAGFPGRDKFIDLLADNGLMLKIRRRKHYKTTDSNHPYRRYPNLIKDRQFSEANQAWASDITYVETQADVCYLSLITDLYSRKIVGWELGDSLHAVHCLKALQKALEGLPDPRQARELIHHSDRGCQYCCYEYVDKLKAHGVKISMTESGDPLENAVAERVNGIIKNEWLTTSKIQDVSDCRERVSKAVKVYNEIRPHMSLGYQTPSAVHEQSGEQYRLWKTITERRATIEAKRIAEQMPDGISE